MMLCLEIILIEKVNEKPSLESVCKYLCIAFKDELNEWIKYILSELRIKDLLIDSDIIPDEWENLKSLLEEVAEDKYSDFDTNKFSKIGKPDN